MQGCCNHERSAAVAVYIRPAQEQASLCSCTRWEGQSLRPLTEKLWAGNREFVFKGVAPSKTARAPHPGLYE